MTYDHKRSPVVDESTYSRCVDLRVFDCVPAKGAEVIPDIEFLVYICLIFH